MAGILLAILKVLGIVLLVLLGLILAVLLLVLFVPLRYRLCGSFHGRPVVRAGASWLLHLLSCQVSYDEGLTVDVRVCGIRIGGSGNEADGGEGEEPSPEPKDTGERTARGAGEPEDSAWETGTAEAPRAAGDFEEAELSKTAGEPAVSEAVKAAGHPAETETSKTAGKSASAGPSKAAGRSAASEPLWQRFRPARLWKRLRAVFAGICGKLKALIRRRDKILAFIRDPENQRTFRNLKKQLGAALRQILPRRIRGTVQFGFDDPSKTGQVLMYVSPFYGFYAKTLTLIPVFEEQVLDGDLDVRGRIRVAPLLVIAGRVLADRNFRKLLRAWRAV
ncbi:MAG TPA: hypothetical protein IAC37_01255 [Candidatus Ventrimonas merdavium]|nr:hypothetical protein [Candidatus Ventrimonas merdavium]